MDDVIIKVPVIEKMQKEQEVVWINPDKRPLQRAHVNANCR